VGGGEGFGAERAEQALKHCFPFACFTQDRIDIAGSCQRFDLNFRSFLIAINRFFPYCADVGGSIDRRQIDRQFAQEAPKYGGR
jgi:hypothetical protein